MSSPKPNRRDVQAQETRRAIIDAARALFTRQGYGATSVAQIAAEAGVAVPTVYTSVGAKPLLLRALLDRIDEESEVGPLAGRLRSSQDAAEVLRLQITITRQLVERCGDIIGALASAAGVEPEMAAAYRAGMERHRGGAEATVGRIRDLGGLRAGLSVGDAAAMLATLTAPPVYASLTQEFGWTYAACQSWLERVLSAQLLADAPR